MSTLPRGRIFALASITCYIMALPFKAISDGGLLSGGIAGYECLVEGYSAHWSWIANPLLLIAWICLLFGKKVSIGFSAAAGFSAIYFVWLFTHDKDPVQLHLGAGLWLASMLYAVAGGVVLLLTRSRPVADVEEITRIEPTLAVVLAS